MPSRTAGETKPVCCLFIHFYMWIVRFTFYKIFLVHTGANSDAVNSRRARHSSQLRPSQTSSHDSSHPSRPDQGVSVHADMEELITEGGREYAEPLIAPNVAADAQQIGRSRSCSFLTFGFQRTRRSSWCPTSEASQWARACASWDPRRSAWQIRWNSGTRCTVNLQWPAK